MAHNGPDSTIIFCNYLGEEHIELGGEQTQPLPPQVPIRAGETGKEAGLRDGGQLCAPETPEADGTHTKDEQQTEEEEGA